MKILVVHASAGGGHKSCAQAIYAYLEKHRSDCDVKLIDLLEYSDWFFRFSYLKGYPYLVHNFLWLWGFFYWLSFYPPFSWVFRLISAIFNFLANRRLVKFFMREDPDYIVAPHFIPPDIAGGLKIARKLRAKIITVITDFGIHPYWINRYTDLYVVYSDYARQQLLDKGIPDTAINATGIPVHEKFLKDYSRRDTAAKLGIKGDVFTILLATGSFGSGPLEKFIDFFCDDAQILVVCANNRKLYKRLSRSKRPHVRLFGFVDNMQELMACSDVMLTKGGGLSISECLAMRLPALFISAIPGQESQNIGVVTSHKAGIDLRGLSLEEIKKVIFDLKLHPEKIESIKGNIELLRKPDAAKDLSNALR